jgi:hypothetical protein
MPAENTRRVTSPVEEHESLFLTGQTCLNLFLERIGERRLFPSDLEFFSHIHKDNFWKRAVLNP